MKKKIFLFFLVACVGVGFLTVGPIKAEAAIKLTYSNFFPPHPHPEQVSRGMV